MLGAIPNVFKARSKLKAKVLVVSRYIASAHRRHALFLGRVLALGVAAHRLWRRRSLARVVVVCRRRAASPVWRLHVKHRSFRFDVRFDLKRGWSYFNFILRQELYVLTFPQKLTHFLQQITKNDF